MGAKRYDGDDWREQFRDRMATAVAKLIARVLAAANKPIGWDAGWRHAGRLTALRVTARYIASSEWDGAPSTLLGWTLRMTDLESARIFADRPRAEQAQRRRGFRNALADVRVLVTGSLGTSKSLREHDAKARRQAVAKVMRVAT